MAHEPRMSPITRSWLAFAAVGTGLIHVALVLGAPPLLGVPLGLLGLAEFVWGVLTFALDRVPLPRVAFAVALLPIVGWGFVLTIATVSGMPELASSLGFLPLVIATLLELAAALMLAVAARSRRSVTVPGVGRYVLGLGAGALVVAALTATALGSSQLGAAVQPTGVVEPQPEHPAH